MVRGSLSQESSHSPTIGMITSPKVEGLAVSTWPISNWHAASYTRPTCMVEVRKMGVSA